MQMRDSRICSCDHDMHFDKRHKADMHKRIINGAWKMMERQKTSEFKYLEGESENRRADIQVNDSHSK